MRTPRGLALWPSRLGRTCNSNGGSVRGFGSGVPSGRRFGAGTPCCGVVGLSGRTWRLLASRFVSERALGLSSDPTINYED